ncbi:MAG TPA: site-2 protease family protein [Candidatus Saccharimonadales bacterium]|nr:site-2 protease family protein [Candidatus Saccharimonadales bacterium]
MFSNIQTSDIITILASLLASLVIHEAMHAYTAHRLGDYTAHEEGRLTLNPAKHLDLYTSILLPMMLLLLHLPPIFIAKPVPFNPHNVRFEEFGVALIGLAGPFTNLILAVLGSIFLHVAGIGLGTDAAHMVLIFMQVNVALFVFNMIPFPPLDGSRLLYAFAPDPVRRVMETIEGAGFIGLIVFILVLIPLVGPIIANITTGIMHLLLR